MNPFKNAIWKLISLCIGIAAIVAANWGFEKASQLESLQSKYIEATEQSNVFHAQTDLQIDRLTQKIESFYDRQTQLKNQLTRATGRENLARGTRALLSRYKLSKTPPLLWPEKTTHSSSLQVDANVLGAVNQLAHDENLGPDAAEQLSNLELLEKENSYEFSSSMQILENSADAMMGPLARLPSAWPIENESERPTWVSSKWGRRKHPLGGELKRHKGLDIAAPYQTPVMATGTGQVIFAGFKRRYGRIVIIDHGENIQTRYAHLASFSVENTQYVKRGELIGKVGSSGDSTGPHLHYEVRAGRRALNPRFFIK